MDAIVFRGVRAVEIARVDEPRLEAPGDALVRVRAAGICGSDLHPYHERERGLDHGTVMGHELVGVIVEVGAEVADRHVGDVVCSPFTTNCGRCFYCRIGLTCRCASGRLFGWVEGGVGLQGAQAELVRVPMADATLMAVPEGVDDAEALLLGDILSTGFFCAEQAGIGTVAEDGTVIPAAASLAGPGAAGTYVVVGCGPVGLMAVVAARTLGAERLFAVDTIPERLAMAERWGAEPLDYRASAVADVVRDATDGRGADAALEVVGSSAAVELAVDLLRPGGTLSSVGVHTDATFPFTPTAAYDKNLTLKSGRCPARYYMPRLAPLVATGVLDVASVFSHRLPLREGAEGYELFDRKLDGCTKVMLVP